MGTILKNRIKTRIITVWVVIKNPAFWESLKICRKKTVQQNCMKFSGVILLYQVVHNNLNSLDKQSNKIFYRRVETIEIITTQNLEHFGKNCRKKTVQQNCMNFSGFILLYQVFHCNHNTLDNKAVNYFIGE